MQEMSVRRQFCFANSLYILRLHNNKKEGKTNKETKKRKTEKSPVSFFFAFLLIQKKVLTSYLDDRIRIIQTRLLNNTAPFYNEGTRGVARGVLGCP